MIPLGAWNLTIRPRFSELCTPCIACSSMSIPSLVRLTTPIRRLTACTVPLAPQRGTIVCGSVRLESRWAGGSAATPIRNSPIAKNAR